MKTAALTNGKAEGAGQSDRHERARAHRPVRSPCGGRRPDGRFRRLGDAHPVRRRHRRRAPRHAQARRFVRRLPHGPVPDPRRRALPFCQHVLTNNAAALEVCQAQYTIISDEAGGAIDDAYLYRFTADEYLLVVNAANRLGDWEHLRRETSGYDDVELHDATLETAMIALQGPRSREILSSVVERGRLPEPLRNELSVLTAAGATVRVGRTGYTGEPLCFELFVAADDSAGLWEALVAGGAAPAGLGARDTLRLEAGLPLYGFELGRDQDGAEIPVFAIALAKLAVSFSPLKGDFIGRAALARQHDAFARVLARDYSQQGRPAAPGAARRRRGLRRGPHARAGVRRKAARRVCDQRHLGALLGRGRRGARLAPDRRAPPAFDRSRLPRLRRGRKRRCGHRHPRDAGAGPGRRLPPAQRRAAAGAADRLRSRAAARRAAPRRRAGQGAPAARRDPRQHLVAADRGRQPHPFGDDGLTARAPGFDRGPVVSLRRTPPVRGLLRRRGLLLPGHRLHRLG